MALSGFNDEVGTSGWSGLGEVKIPGKAAHTFATSAACLLRSAAAVAESLTQTRAAHPGTARLFQLGTVSARRTAFTPACLGGTLKMLMGSAGLARYGGGWVWGAGG